MTEVQIAEFADTCLAVLERVQKTGQPVVVTRAGRPVARIVPPQPPRKDWLGCMKDCTEIKGDIVSPAADPSDWDALSR